MEKTAAIEKIRVACNAISRELMSIHPAVPALGDKEAQDEIFKSLFALTTQLEAIKKRLAKLEKRDQSELL